MKPATQHGRAHDQGEDRVGRCGLDADDGQQQQAEGDRHLVAHEDEAHDRQRRDSGDRYEQWRRRRSARKHDGQRERGCKHSAGTRRRAPQGRHCSDRCTCRGNAHQARVTMIAPCAHRRKLRS